MSESREKRMTVDELPRVSQKLRLTCQQCGKTDTYDVGSVFYSREGEGESAKYRYGFTNYFRCRGCASAAPWEIADYIKLTGLMLRATVSRRFEGFYEGQTVLFDGTLTQTPAQGEDHLRGLIEQDPKNPFLHSRLANLFRGCGQTAWAAEWYAKTLELDPGDLESRYHLLNCAAEAGDIPALQTHLPLLVRHLLAGRTTNKPELTRGIALAVADTLRNAPAQVRERFLGPAAPQPKTPAERFIVSVLQAEGDEDEIVEAATDCLLAGESELAWEDEAASETVESIEPAIDLIASLRAVVEPAGLNLKKLGVAFLTDDEGRVRIEDRHVVSVSDGQKLARWPVASLEELWRGDRVPTVDMNHYPPEYCLHFFFIEKQVLTLCDVVGDLSDQELEGVYGTLRRRPDCRSLGLAHDFLWQVAALLLGKYVLSRAEFDAIFGQLARSTRHWRQRPISRNYVAYLRNTFGDDRG